MASVAAREREVFEQPGDALVKDRPVVATGLVAERRGQPTFADAGRTDQGQIILGADPFALDQLLEQGAVTAARTTVIDILDAGLLTQLGEAQSRRQTFVAPQRRLTVAPSS